MCPHYKFEYATLIKIKYYCDHWLWLFFHLLLFVFHSPFKSIDLFRSTTQSFCSIVINSIFISFSLNRYVSLDFIISWWCFYVKSGSDRKIVIKPVVRVFRPDNFFFISNSSGKYWKPVFKLWRISHRNFENFALIVFILHFHSFTHVFICTHFYYRGNSVHEILNKIGAINLKCLVQFWMKIKSNRSCDRYVQTIILSQTILGVYVHIFMSSAITSNRKITSKLAAAVQHQPEIKIESSKYF